MENKSIINIEQTLHGYSGGHTLIASSSKISADSKRMMLPISDMSGSSMHSGFEIYYTGYPLKYEKKYALAKTWYASEMKRPGCVWTHTLLIDFTDLPKIKNISLLISKFTRPSGKKIDKVDYGLPIRYDVNSSHIDSIYGFGNENLVKEILEGLYTSTGSVLVNKNLVKDGGELVALSIWKQLWPKLRRDFSFCTGAIMPRTFQGELLDLQFVSPKLDQSQLSHKRQLYIDRKRAEGNIKFPDWVELAYRNLITPSVELEKFLSFYGSDAQTDRSAFKEIAEAYLFFKNTDRKLDDAIIYMAKKFKSKTEATGLKMSLFGNSNTPFKAVLPKYDEMSVILYFYSTPHIDSFDYQKLMVKERLFNLFSHISEPSISFLKSLLNSDLNVLGEEAVLELPKALNIQTDLTLIWSDKNLSNLFVSLNPKFAYEIDFWKQQLGNEAEIVSILQNVESFQELNWKSIINNLMELRVNINLNSFGAKQIGIGGYILEWINASSKQINNIGDIEWNWLEYLKSNVNEVLNWMNSKTDITILAMLVISSILDPNSPEVLNFGLTPWLKASKVYELNKFEINALELHSFLLCIAFNNNVEESKILFETSFEPIYHALAHDELKYDYWNRLELHAKPLNLIFNWDKCKRITKAVVEHYIKNSWLIYELTQSIYDKELSMRVQIFYSKKKN